MPTHIHLLIAALLIGISSASAVAADEPSPPPGAVPPEDPPTYIGGRTRIGVGYQSRDQLRGELYHVITEDKSSAFIGEAWLSGRDSRYGGGLKLSYQWLPESEARLGASVRKAFVAVDQNLWHDRKLTLGGGLENEAWFFGAYFSGGITGRRELSADSNAVVQTIEGVDGDRPYLQDITTTTTLRTFERPYDHGLGLRLGTFVEPALLRITGGLDHEWGKGDAQQTTGSIALEKFFYNSPHSLALLGEYFRKSGPFETDRDDHRVSLVWRYELGGKSHRPIRESKVVRVETPAPPPPPAEPVSVAPPPPRAEKRAVKVTASMAADAFFKFDSAQLTDDAKKALDGVIATLRNNRVDGNIMLTGHTCDIGAEEYNLALSMRRAMAVKKYLVQIGALAPEVLVAEGRGEAKPRFPNSKAMRNKNRRVDLEFLTFTEKLEDVVLPAEVVASKPASPAAKREPIIEWRREYLDTEPAWIRRALHNTVSHKQAVDVYRQQDKEVTVSEGPRRYVNRPPVAANDTYTVLPDSVASQFEVLNNDSDPDGDALSLTAVGSPSHGSASIAGNRVSYSPSAGFSGGDNFTYTISDGKGGTASATVSVNVVLPNRPPVAVDDRYEVVAGNSSLFAVLGNDSDPDGDTLSLISVGSPTHGVASISNGQISYLATAGYSGNDSFTYNISDGRGGNASATVTVVVRAANGPPVANSDSYSVASGSQNNVFAVLSNDLDPDGDSLSIVSVTIPAHGAVVISGSQLSYTPTPGYSGSDSFSYTISDGFGGTASATVTVTIRANNRPPIANADSYSVLTGSQNNAFAVLANDQDPDGDSLSIINVGNALHGTVSINGSQLSYTPTAGYAGSDSFSYTISDGLGGTATALVSVTIGSMSNRPPVANDDTYTVYSFAPVVMRVLENDYDPDGDRLTIVSFTQPLYGQVALNDDGTLSFTLTQRTLLTTFTYTISDGKGGTSTATVTVIDP